MTIRNKTAAATVGELRKLLAGFPDELPVEFSPITTAWLGVSGALRVHREPHVYDADGECCGPLAPGAYLNLHLHEIDRDET